MRCVFLTKGREMPAIGRSEDRLRHVLSPLYVQLFNLIGQLEGGVKFLVDLRADLIVSFIYYNTTVKLDWVFYLAVW